MNTIECKTQARLDKAIKKQKPGDVIVCLGGTPYHPLIVSGSSSVEAWGTSSVVARESSSVVARESSRVVARESSRVVAWESSRVVAWESSSVVAWGTSSVVARESSSVVAWESSSVVAWGTSSVVARESSRVVARGTSSVEAWESSSVEAWESSSVVAWGTSSVEAWGTSRVVARETSSVVARESSSVVARESASVEASTLVFIHRHGKSATVKGGVIIQIPPVENMTPAEWCGYFGVKVTRGTAYVFKALDDDFSTDRARPRGIFYTPGSSPKCDDFNERQECGGGLHGSPSPAMALAYNSEATRFVCCPVKLAEIVVIDNKVKVPRIAGKVFEVDRHGERVAA